MSKYEFVTEFEINASEHMIFPYLSTASGLKDWFAEDVYQDRDKTYNFVWNGKDYKAKIVSLHPDHKVRYHMLSEEGGQEDDPAFLEFSLDFSELTQSSFLTIVDYSEMDDDEELQDLWENMVENLREALGA